MSILSGIMRELVKNLDMQIYFVSYKSLESKVKDFLLHNKI